MYAPREMQLVKTSVFVIALAACGGEPSHISGSSASAGGADSNTSASSGGNSAGTTIAAEPQRPGDAAAGYAALVNEGYVSCGIPWTAYSAVFGPAPDSLRLPGRTGRNAELPYMYTAFTTRDGVEVVAPNCLTCHASVFRGEVVIGLGTTVSDFTNPQSDTMAFADMLLVDPEEKAELAKFVERVRAVEKAALPTVVGVNPADNIAAVLFAHRDRQTLAWSNEPLLPLPDPYVLPVDVPPWWRMAKKNAMFYSGAGRGDHARIMMTASTLCTDSVEEAKHIDTYFDDIAAFVRSVQPPSWPHALDASLAAAGRSVFEANCARCHGTYGPGATCPNLLVSLEEVGTDPAIGSGASQFAQVYVDWFNGSFYGETARLEIHDGYVAPPLDGIWATAPYLHNGSVPTLEALLESSKRPKFWARDLGDQDFSDDDYDPVAVGWRFTPKAGGHDTVETPGERSLIYDTTQRGYGNGGHTFGDTMTSDDRRALLEYLKTL